MQRFEFHSKIKGLPYSSDNSEILELEGFDHQMLDFPLFSFSPSEITPFLSSERINIVI